MKEDIPNDPERNQIVITASRPWYNWNFKEIFQFRDLFYILAYRDLRVRYAQTALGLLWALVQPAATLLILTLIFGRAIKIDTGGVPYPIFALAGLIPWTYFSFVMKEAGNSVIAAQNMIKKIYFPRMFIPLSKAVVGFVDLIITFLFYIVLMIIYSHTPPTSILYLPLFIVMLIISALAVGIWLSALTIRFRDFQHIVPFLVQIGLYAAPVAYPSTIIPDKYLVFYYLNPVVGIVEGFRWCLVGTQEPHMLSLLSFAVVGVLFISGLFYFNKAEKTIADIV